jgi:hypothetical protein
MEDVDEAIPQRFKVRQRRASSNPKLLRFGFRQPCCEEEEGRLIEKLARVKTSRGPVIISSLDNQSRRTRLVFDERLHPDLGDWNAMTAVASHEKD